MGLKKVIKGLKSFKGIDRLIDTANDAKQAIELVKKGLQQQESGNRGYVYCLIFMDLQMEPVDGYDTTVKIRELYGHDQQPRVVACTGHCEPKFIDKAWRHDFDELAPKPIQAPILQMILADMFE